MIGYLFTAVGCLLGGIVIGMTIESRLVTAKLIEIIVSIKYPSVEEIANAVLDTPYQQPIKLANIIEEANKLARPIEYLVRHSYENSITEYYKGYDSDLAYEAWIVLSRLNLVGKSEYIKNDKIHAEFETKLAI